jgi:hypothetical protein
MHYTHGQLIILFTYLPVLVSAVMAAIRFKSTDKPRRLLCLLIFFAFLVESISRVFWFYKTSNLFLWPIYIITEFGLLLWMYSLVLENNFLVKARLWIWLAFLGLTISRFINQSGQSILIDNLGRLIESALVIFFALAYYFKLFQELKVQTLWLDPFFWISGGLLLFFSGSFLIFIFINFILLYSQSLNDQVWIIHAFLNYLLYSIYTFALWLSPKK